METYAVMELKLVVILNNCGVYKCKKKHFFDGYMTYIFKDSLLIKKNIFKMGFGDKAWNTIYNLFKSFI